MANLFRMSTGGGGEVIIDDVLTPGTTGYTGTIQVGDLEDADTLVIDATENPTATSGVRSWELTTGSDFDKVTHFGTKVETPSTVVNVALGDGVASHTHATASDVAIGKYFWNANGEYVQGTASLT